MTQVTDEELGGSASLLRWLICRFCVRDQLLRRDARRAEEAKDSRGTFVELDLIEFKRKALRLPRQVALRAGEDTLVGILWVWAEEVGDPSGTG